MTSESSHLPVIVTVCISEKIYLRIFGNLRYLCVIHIWPFKATTFSFRFLSNLHCRQPRLTVLIFLQLIIMSGRLAKIRWSGCISKSQRSLCVYLIHQDGIWIVYIPYVRKVNVQLLAQFPIDPLVYQVCLVLFSFCATFLHSFIMWSIFLSLSLHLLHLLVSHVLSTIAFIWLGLMA